MRGEDFEEVAHTGGKLIVSPNGSVQYEHSNPTPCTVFPIRGELELHVTDGDGSNPRVEKYSFEIFLISDREGMFGRNCPRCKEYFRVGTPAGNIICPYCRVRADANYFLTQPQREYINAYTKAIREALSGGQVIEINLDTLVEQIDNNKSPFSYKEVRQQTQVRCSRCRCKYDIFGLYGACPNCGHMNSLDMLLSSLSVLQERIEKPRFDKNQRAERESEWGEIIKSCVSSFEGFASDLVRQLRRIPATKRRRKGISEINFMNPTRAHENLINWFDIELLKGFSTDERTFIIRWFARRHLLTHRSGIVDQEYIDDTNDFTVKPGQKIRVRSSDARQMILLTRKMGENFFEGWEQIDWDFRP